MQNIVAFEKPKMSSLTVEELNKLDLYALLDVAESAAKEDLVKAYRKKAVRLHPDKNPDPAAGMQFIQLSKAFEILTDVKARAAYDRMRQARRAVHERNEKLDSHRKKLKADLEKREAAATGHSSMGKSGSSTSLYRDADREFTNEIDRLRREGNVLLQQEQEELKRRVAASKAEPKTPAASLPAQKRKIEFAYDPSKFDEFEAMVLGKMKRKT